jgi:hypothetical protein
MLADVVATSTVTILAYAAVAVWCFLTALAG